MEFRVAQTRPFSFGSNSLRKVKDQPTHKGNKI